MEPPLILLGEPVSHGSGQPSHPRLPRPSTIARLAILLHIVLAAILLLSSPQDSSELVLVAALAVPLSQVSLVALWAGTRRMASVWQWAVTLAGTSWGWLLTLAVLPGIGARGIKSAGWAAGLATQAATILVVLALWRLRQPIDASEPDASRLRRRTQYTVGSLLGWVTLVAVVLGVGKTAVALLGWEDVTQWDCFCFMPVFGLFSALDALLVAWSLSKPRGRLRRGLITIAAIAALASLQPQALVLLSGDAGGSTFAEFLVLAAWQAVILYATLLPPLAWALRARHVLSVGG